MSAVAVDSSVPTITCPTLLDSFLHNDVFEATPLYIGNSVLDAIFKFKSITDADITELNTLLSTYSSDTSFNTLVMKLFTPSNSALQLKTFIDSTIPSHSLSEVSAFNILATIASATKNTTIQRFILFLTTSPIDLYTLADAKYSKLDLYYTAFNAYLHMEFLPKYISSHLSSPSRNNDPFTLLAFICQNDASSHLECTKLSHLNTRLSITSLSTIWNQLSSDAECILEKSPIPFTISEETPLLRTCGFNVDGSLVSAVKIFSYITPIWDQMSASSYLRDKLIPIANQSLSGGNSSSYTDSDIVRVYAGNYSLVSKSEPLDSTVNVDFVTNFDTFNQLSSNRKLQVSRFLSANRKRFNDILENSTKIIMNALRQKLNTTVVAKALSSSDFKFARASNIGFKDSDDTYSNILADTNNFTSKLAEAFRSTQSDSYLDAINFITHSYIPMLSHFESKCMTRYGMNARTVFNQFASNPALNFIGICSYVTNSAKPLTSLSGGNNTQSQPLQGIPHPRRFTRPFTGGSSTSTLIQEFIDGQKSFNKSFEDIYRKLISALAAVNPQSVVKMNQNTLYTICDQFNSIAINKPKTTIYLSGFYGSRDYNRLYANTLRSIISSIKSSSIDVFSNVVSVLESLLNLIESTRQKMLDLRNRYVTAPKSVSETVIASCSEIKQPCNLSQSDFNSFRDAVTRIRNVIKETALESSFYNAKQCIESYINNVQDRTKIITEHYADNITKIKNEYNINYQKEAIQGRDIKITLEEQKRDALLYLNSVVDMQLTKEKLNDINQLSLNEEQLKTIERAYTSFKNIQVTDEFHAQIKKIAKLLDYQTTTLANVFKLMKKLRKLVITGNYFNFLSQLHRELKILADFDWNTFSQRLASLIVVSAIKICMKRKIGPETISIERWIHDRSTEFEETCQKYNKIQLTTTHDVYPLPINSGYMLMKDYLSAVIVRDTRKLSGSKINVDGASLGNITFKQLLKVEDSENFVLNPGVHVSAADFLSAHPEENFANEAFNELHAKYGGKTVLPFYFKNFNLYYNLINLACATWNLKNLEFNNTTSTHEYFFEINNTSEESTLVNYTFEAFTTNIIALVDKYWSVRYSGNLSLPLNVSTALRGGDQQDGGSIFDVARLSRHTSAAIIPEAVPFYICAIHVCQHYIEKYGTSNISDEDEFKLHLKINKVSTLYRVYEVFKKEGATIQSLTVSQLQTLVEVFNTIWNQVQGNAAAKLSRSIDILFNELNASIIFSNKLQIDTFKNTGSLSTKTINILNKKLSTLVSALQSSIRETMLNGGISLEEQSKYFEDALSRAYKKVSESTDVNRYMALKTVLYNDNRNEDIFKEYYKFMELVVIPMLTAASSYSNIFQLFDSFSVNLKPVNEIKTIDLREYSIKINAKEHTIWELIDLIRDQGKGNLVGVLSVAPVVTEWNKVLLRNALDDFRRKKTFTLPTLWQALRPETYPRTPTLKPKFGSETTINSSNKLLLLKQLYPNVKAFTISDYYRHVLAEFRSDYEHFVQNFMSYPGISDKTLNIIERTFHSTLKAPEGFDDLQRTFRLSEDDKSRNKQYLQTLESIKVERAGYYIPPPSLPNDFIIPHFNAISIPVEQLTINDHPFTTNCVRLENTNLYVACEDRHAVAVHECNYRWIDWVIFQLAKCDKTSFCLPYKLTQMLRNNNELGSVLKTAIFYKKVSANPSAEKVSYSRNTDGAYESIISQNIITRSETQQNAEKEDYATLNSAWIAGLIAITPYLINTLTAAKECMKPTVMYRGINVHNEITFTCQILQTFYDEIVNHTPFMGFMTDTIQLSSSKVRPHLFAELLSFIETKDASNMDINDFIKLEWANMYFFTSLDDIVFPDFKNRDKFEWIREYAPDKLGNGMFGNSFTNTVSNLGRLAWSSVISKSDMLLPRVDADLEKYEELILNSINILHECDFEVIQRFINNLLDLLFDRNTTLINRRLTGGGIVLKQWSTEDRDDIMPLFNNLTHNILKVDGRFGKNTGSVLLHDSPDKFAKFEDLDSEIEEKEFHRNSFQYIDEFRNTIRELSWNNRVLNVKLNHVLSIIERKTQNCNVQIRNSLERLYKYLNVVQNSVRINNFTLDEKYVTAIEAIAEQTCQKGDYIVNNLGYPALSIQMGATLKFARTNLYESLDSTRAFKHLRYMFDEIYKILYDARVFAETIVKALNNMLNDDTTDDFKAPRKCLIMMYGDFANTIDELIDGTCSAYTELYAKIANTLQNTKQPESKKKREIDRELAQPRSDNFTEIAKHYRNAVNNIVKAVYVFNEKQKNLYNVNDTINVILSPDFINAVTTVVESKREIRTEVTDTEVQKALENATNQSIELPSKEVSSDDDDHDEKEPKPETETKTEAEEDRKTIPPKLKSVDHAENILQFDSINDRNKILQIAYYLASIPSLRAQYTDPTLKNENKYTFTLNNQPFHELSFYKYLYNTSLLSDCNSKYTPFEYIVIAISEVFNYNLFTIRSLCYNEPLLKLNKLNEASKLTEISLSKDMSTEGDLKKNIRVNIDNDYEHLITENRYTLSFNVRPKLIKIPEDYFSVFIIGKEFQVPANAMLTLFSPQRELFDATYLNNNIINTHSFVGTTNDIFNKTRGCDYAELLKYGRNTVDSCIYNNVSINDILAFDSSFNNRNNNEMLVFIENLLVDNISGVFDGINKTANSGFDVGSLKPVHRDIDVPSFTGGAFQNVSSYCAKFIDVNNAFSETNVAKLLDSVYNPSEDLNAGVQLYKNIFKFFTGANNSANYYSFGVIVNYFHKYNISFNAIYNQICFPSILYNASIFESFLTGLRTALSSFGDQYDIENANDESYKNGRIKFISNYITSIGGDTEATKSFTYLNPEYQFIFSKVKPREPDMSFTKVLSNLDKSTDEGHPSTSDKTVWYGNMYYTPSVNNNFYSELLNYITFVSGECTIPLSEGTSGVYRKNLTDDKFKGTNTLYSMISSSFLTNLRHLDLVSTLTYVIFTLLHQTSYYDLSYEKDITFFKVNNPEPLSNQ